MVASHRVGLYLWVKVCVKLLLSTGCKEGMDASVASAAAVQMLRLSFAVSGWVGSRPLLVPGW